MNTYKIPNTDLTVSRIGYGCAGLGGHWDKVPVSSDTVSKAVVLIRAAYDHGITLFDHADVYAYGKSEVAFGQVLKQSPGLREKIVIQSKCGIRLGWPFQEPPPNDPHYLDFSYSHILSAVEASLERLHTDYLDILLIHHPDPLMQPEEVARAFDELKRSGKVRYFGVSNHEPVQIELLKRSLHQPLVVNQVSMGLAHSDLIAEGMDTMLHLLGGQVRGRGGGTLDYCRLNHIQVQGYSPLRGEVLKPSANPTLEVQCTAQRLTELAREKNVTPSAIALAWLLHHPAGIIPVVGSTDPEHLIENYLADEITLGQAEWYSLFALASRIPGTVIK
jgi:predicted oxidoreductase